MPQIQVFEPEGRAIPYTDEGEGPVVVLLPARGLNISYLATLAAALEEAGHRVVRVGSRRAHRASDATTMHDLAQDVVDVMDHLGLEDAWVGGHGFGGALARTVSLDHTDRVGGVLLLGVETAAPQDASAHEALRAEFADLLAAAADAEVEPLQTAALAATPEAEWAGLATTVPVLVIQGTDDRITPPANGTALQASAPDRVSVVPIDGAGHLFAATHAGLASWAIEDYLDWD